MGAREKQDFPGGLALRAGGAPNEPRRSVDGELSLSGCGRASAAPAVLVRREKLCVSVLRRQVR